MSGYAPYEQDDKMEEVETEFDMSPNYVQQHRSTGEKYMQNMFSYDYKEIAKKIIKYVLEGVAIALVAYYFMSNKLSVKDIFILGVSAAASFAILDQFSPTVALGARFGAGLGIGQSIVGAAGSLAPAAVY